MTGRLHRDAVEIFSEAITAMLPDNAVKRSLSLFDLKEEIILIGIGKASWMMAKSAAKELDGRIRAGAIITKYGHSRGPISGIEIFEAGHPLPDINTLKATDRVLDITSGTREEQSILFLVSGGGSALFEKPDVGLSLNFIAEITSKLLLRGADIKELNTVRKHLSSVKGGKFAIHCLPAHIFQITLSDVIGDSLDIIASGPAASDLSTSEEALVVLKKYEIPVLGRLESVLKSETPKSLTNVSYHIAGNVSGLCLAAKEAADKRGYSTEIITDKLEGEARSAGEIAADLAIHKIRNDISQKIRSCMIWGGETTVKVKGRGKGGRNQELALAAAQKISGNNNIVILSAGSDGTDGPTDAAGGIVDGLTWKRIKLNGGDPSKLLDDNDSHNALKLSDSLFMTGPTGTNVNDLVIVLIDNC